MPARAGHFDELRGATDGAREMTAPWRAFFDLLGPGLVDLDRHAESVARQIRENGITYNVYADTDGPARPWSLDLLPLIVTPEDWAQIERGVIQRTALLNEVLRDVYGTQELIAEGLLPPALTVGHPGYLHALKDVRPAGDVYLHIAAFDLARAPDGQWRVVSQRTQAPSGLGYVLENRLTISRQFPEAFRELRVQHLAATYRALVDTLFHLSGAGQAARVVLLTPGPYNETYFEHAYLSRYLGLPLVEGGDLTVRDDKLFLKTLYGLERVHAVLRRLDDDFCDPLELRSDSTLGIPGLVQAMRAGNVVVANALGSGFLESAAVIGFLPAIARRVLGEPLELGSLDTWWCGERAVLDRVLPELDKYVIKPTAPQAGFEPMVGMRLTKDELAQWRAAIAAHPERYTVQEYLPLAQLPTWQGGRLVPRHSMLRVYAVRDRDEGWRVLPGGLTRLGAYEEPTVSMQRGGSSADTWVMTTGEVDAFSMLPKALQPEDLAHKRRPVSSRSAENLFWVGRYSERAECAAQLALRVLGMLNGDSATPPTVLSAIGRVAVAGGLVAPEVPTPDHGLRVFERALIADLPDATHARSLGFNLAALERAAGHIRDRLAPEHWRTMLSAREELASLHVDDAPGSLPSGADVLPVLDRVLMLLSSITGKQTDRMTRDDGWRLLTIGRMVERLATMAGLMRTMLESGAPRFPAGFTLMLHLFDSAITYRAHYQRRIEMVALIDLLVMDAENPRALACCVQHLRAALARLPECAGDAGNAKLVELLPDPSLWSLAALCARADDGHYPALEALASELIGAAMEVSDEIGLRYFAQTDDWFRAVTA